MGEQIVTIHEPDGPIRKGYLKLWKEIFQETKDSKWLIWQLFLRNFKGIYSQSILGIAWVLIMPLGTLLTFIVLKGTGIFDVGEIKVPYAIYAILGLTFWQIFATGIQRSTNSLVSAGGMLKRIYFPREVLVFSSLGTIITSFLIQMILVFLLFVVYSFIPNWHIIFLPLMTIPLLLLTCGLGFIFSLINGVIRDLGRLLSFGLIFLLFITPIAYEKPDTGVITTLANINPVYYLSVAPREIALTGNLSDPFSYFISCAFSIFIFFVCWMSFHLAEPRIIERL
ncbi:MAG: ABC transporter permease [Candidatus Hodarchaeota archaeon]